MKRLVIFLCTAFSFCTACLDVEAQTRNIYELMRRNLLANVESKWEYNSSTERRELNYYNYDYCLYLLSRKNDKDYLLSPGKTTVFSYKTGEENLWKTSSSYMYYRGCFVRNLKIDVPYALPVKNGAKVQWIQDVRQPQKTLRFLMEPYDTVYAVRGGVACKIDDPKSLLVAHDDMTMAIYISMDQSFIVPGEKIKAGQPVGIADHGGVGISWCFLDENRFIGGDPVAYPYAHFIPFFSTSEGLVQTKPGQEYECVLSDEVIMLDMSKAERKRYMKNKR